MLSPWYSHEEVKRFVTAASRSFSISFLLLSVAAIKWPKTVSSKNLSTAIHSFPSLKNFKRRRSIAFDLLCISILISTFFTEFLNNYIFDGILDKCKFWGVSL